MKAPKIQLCLFLDSQPIAYFIQAMIQFLKNLNIEKCFKLFEI